MTQNQVTVPTNIGGTPIAVSNEITAVLGALLQVKRAKKAYNKVFNKSILKIS